MAKSKSGLPEGFDINVSAVDLEGPAKLPGYLDDDPVLELARLTRERQREGAGNSGAATNPPQERGRQMTQELKPISAPEPKMPEPTSIAPTPEVSARPSAPRRRLQVNLDPEGERMVEELLDLVSDQSSERRIKISELVQALVLNLYNARSEISLGSIPPRGRWGSPTAKSFPTALAQAFREAIVSNDRRIGGNQFKKAIGG